MRSHATALGFGQLALVQLLTAANELGRNVLVHAGDGAVDIERAVAETKEGIRLVFTDHGPGIPDIALAQRDGFSSAGGLGLGLGGARRLVDEFELASTAGEGTVVAIVRWR